MKMRKRVLAALLCTALAAQSGVFAADLKTLEDENNAYLSMYPKTKTFAQATLLDGEIAQVDRIELSSGNTGQRTTLTDGKQIAALYDSLRGMTLTRGLYQGASAYGYALDFYDGDEQVAGFVQSAFGTLAQRISGELAVTYRLEGTDASQKFGAAVQPYFAAALLEENDRASSWARGDLSAAARAGILPDRLADSDLRQPVSRWKFCEIAELLIGRRKPPTPPKPMSDCPYEGYACEVTAWQYGLLEGRDGGFASNDILTRQECAAIAARALKLYGKSAGPAKSYADLDAAAPWARDAVQACGTLFSGDTNGNFRPEEPMSAEEALLVMMRLYRAVGS